MKLNQLRQLIKEELEAIQQEEYTPVDEVGKFFVVKKPKGKMTKEDMVYEATVFDEIKMDETKGVYKNKSEANRHATEVLKEYEMQLNVCALFYQLINLLHVTPTALFSQQISSWQNNKFLIGLQHLIQKYYLFTINSN